MKKKKLAAIFSKESGDKQDSILFVIITDDL
jgi:hypothetical protein